METALFLKEIASWHRQWVIDLSHQNSQVDRVVDRQTLNQMAQDMISQSVTLQICHDRGIPLHSPLIQPQPGTDANLLQSAIQRLPELKQTCQIAALPIELLGQMHEQFLATHQATVRRAQGVYYTPVAIVDYMVNSTLGLRLQNKSVEDVRHRPFRILDPACGSGAFLLRAYQYLLQWYRVQYLAKLEQYRSQLYQQSSETWHLTIAAKQQILLGHLFGLDINQDAVNVTQRSLLLQMLEGSVEYQERQPDYAFDPAILQLNIQCGNALIDLDFYQLNHSAQFTPEAVNQINAFSWNTAFPQIIESGGFEVILSNPPWVFTRNARFDDRIKRYFQIKYLSKTQSVQRSKSRQTGKVNLFVLFLFQCIELMHKDGQLGIIVPNTLLRTTVYETARKYILDRCSIEQIVDLGHEVFSGVTASSALLILGKKLGQSTLKFIDAIEPEIEPERFSTLNKTDFLQNTSYVFSVCIDQAQTDLFQKVSASSIPLKSLASEMIEGIVCRKDQIKPQPESDRDQRILQGKDITRYCISFRERYILFDRKQLHRPRPDHVWSAKEKIILRRIGGGEFALVAALDTEHYYAFASTNNILLKADQHYNIRYILALLNSQLLNYYYIQKFTNQSRLTVNISKTFLEQLPIRSINFDCPIETSQHDRLVHQVESLQRLHRQLPIVTSTLEQQDLQQQIQAIDQQINQWVYELYGLTEAEIAQIKTPTAR